MYWLEQLTHQIVRVDVQDDCSDNIDNNNKATEKQDNKTALEAIRNEIMFLKSKIESLHSETSKQFEQIKSSKGLHAGDSPQLTSEPAPAPHNARSLPLDGDGECDLVRERDKTSELQSLDDVIEYEDDYEEDADDCDDDQLTLHSSPGAPDSGYSAGTSSLTLTSLASSVSPPRPSCRRGPAPSRRSASVIGTVHL